MAAAGTLVSFGAERNLERYRSGQIGWVCESLPDLQPANLPKFACTW